MLQKKALDSVNSKTDISELMSLLGVELRLKKSFKSGESVLSFKETKTNANDEMLFIPFLV
jgi:hypothetical protein